MGRRQRFAIRTRAYPEASRVLAEAEDGYRERREMREELLGFGDDVGRGLKGLVWMGGGSDDWLGFGMFLLLLVRLVTFFASVAGYLGWQKRAFGCS